MALIGATAIKGLSAAAKKFGATATPPDAADISFGDIAGRLPEGSKAKDWRSSVARGARDEELSTRIGEHNENVDLLNQRANLNVAAEAATPLPGNLTPEQFSAVQGNAHHAVMQDKVRTEGAKVRAEHQAEVNKGVSEHEHGLKRETTRLGEEAKQGTINVASQNKISELTKASELRRGDLEHATSLQAANKPSLRKIAGESAVKALATEGTKMLVNQLGEQLNPKPPKPSGRF